MAVMIGIDPHWQLVAAGERVLDVQPKLAARVCRSIQLCARQRVAGE